MIHISDAVISDAARVLNDPNSTADALSVAGDFLRMVREAREHGGTALVVLTSTPSADEIMSKYSTRNQLAGPPTLAETLVRAAGAHSFYK